MSDVCAYFKLGAYVPLGNVKKSSPLRTQPFAETASGTACFCDSGRLEGFPLIAGAPTAAAPSGAGLMTNAGMNEIVSTKFKRRTDSPQRTTSEGSQ